MDKKQPFSQNPRTDRLIDDVIRANSAAPATQKPIPPSQPISLSPTYEKNNPATAPHKFIQKPKNKAPAILYSMAALIFIIGLGVSLLGFKNNQNVIKQVQAISSSSEDSGDNPDETDPPPDSVDNYKVAPDLPKVITIKKIGVKARVLGLNVKANNEMQAPSNIYDTGWYQGSAKPGDPGATLIDGHVHGITKPGVFYKMKDLSQGDIISIERGDGKILNYKVVDSKAYSKDNVDMAAALTSVQPGKSGLNLITCTGNFNPKNNQYEDRLIVFAVLSET